jgi:hypothetical protein
MIQRTIASWLIRAGARLLDTQQLATVFAAVGATRGLAMQISVPTAVAAEPTPAPVVPGCTPCEARARAKQAEAEAAGIHPEVTHETPGPEAAEAVATKTTTFTVPRDDARALFGAYAERKVIEWRKSQGVWQPWQYDEPDTQPTLAAARWQDEEIEWQVPAQTQHTIPYKLLVAQRNDAGDPVVYALRPELFALLLTAKTDSVFYYDWQEPIIDRSITLWLKDRT